jgi:hypothetical protein
MNDALRRGQEADTMNKLVMVLMGLVAAAMVLVPVITEAALIS